MTSLPAFPSFPDKPTLPAGLNTSSFGNFNLRGVGGSGGQVGLNGNSTTNASGDSSTTTVNASALGQGSSAQFATDIRGGSFAQIPVDPTIASGGVEITGFGNSAANSSLSTTSTTNGGVESSMNVSANGYASNTGGVEIAGSTQGAFWL